MSDPKPTPPSIVRAVLLERYIATDPEQPMAPRVVLFGRAMWASTKRAEFKGWVSTAQPDRAGLDLVPQPVRSRSRSLSGCRDPMLAQQWAFELWDEYVADVVRGAVTVT